MVAQVNSTSRRTKRPRVLYTNFMISDFLDMQKISLFVALKYHAWYSQKKAQLRLTVLHLHDVAVCRILSVNWVVISEERAEGSGGEKVKNEK